MALDFPVSFSFLNEEANCPYKAYRRYVVRDLPREEKTAAQTYGINVHKALELRINEGKPLVAPFDKFEPIAGRIADCHGKDVDVRAERKFAISRNEGPLKDYWDKSALLRVVVDVSVIAFGQHRAHIFDWKTAGKVREDPFELEIQAWALKTWYPGLEVIKANYIWLKENKLGLEHDVSDTERTAASVRAQLAEIDRRGDVWPKRPGPLCPWCPCLDCEHHPGEKR